MWLISDSTWNAKHTFIGYIAALTNNSKSHWLNRTKLYFSLTLSSASAWVTAPGSSPPSAPAYNAAVVIQSLGLFAP